VNDLRVVPVPDTLVAMNDTEVVHYTMYI